MLVPVTCPHCDHAHKIGSTYAGTMRKCPACSTPFLFEKPADVTLRHPTQSDDTAKTRYRRLTAGCPDCRHEFQVDAAYLNTTRKCPKCSHRFLFSTPAEGESEGWLRGRTMLACTHCFRYFGLQPQFEAAGRSPCGICGRAVETAEGRDLHRRMDEAEGICRTALLNGARHDSLTDRIAALSLPDPLATQLPDLQLRELPFTRFNERTYAIPANCDTCSWILDDEQPYEIIWRHSMVQEETSATLTGIDVLGALAGGGSAKVQKISSVKHSRLTGHYFLCTVCRSQMESTFRNPFTDYPVTVGYSLEKIRPIQVKTTRRSE